MIVYAGIMIVRYRFLTERHRAVLVELQVKVLRLVAVDTDPVSNDRIVPFVELRNIIVKQTQQFVLKENVSNC